MKQFFAFVRKEFFHVLRDPKTLLILFGLPIAQITLFGFALTNEIKNSRIVIVDNAKDELSSKLIHRLSNSEHFEVVGTLESSDLIEEAFQAGDVHLAITFPPHLEADVSRAGGGQIQVIADASDPNTATALTTYVRQIALSHLGEEYGLSQQMGINPEIRMLYNPELKGAHNFVPGVLAMVLMLVCVLMTSVSIVREKELGTMEVLLVSPVNPLLVILAKAVPYFALSLVNLVIILLMSVYLLDMPINGSLSLLFAESALLILTALSLGLLISNVTTSQQVAMLISLMALMMPVMLFTGFMFPLENMPVPLQIIANLVPTKWYYIIVKSVMIKGLGLAAIWKETLILVGMTTFLLVLSFKKFKQRLA
jgi:ABC-2 type transport system permease protein